MKLTKLYQAPVVDDAEVDEDLLNGTLQVIIDLFLFPFLFAFQ